MHHGPAPDRSGSADPHGVGRAIPDLGARARGAGDRGRGAAPPDLEDGQKDHRGFGDPRQRGARGDRGPLPVRPGLRVGRGGRAPAVGRTRVRRVRGRVGAGTGGIPEHGAADSLRPHAPRARPRLGDAALRSRGGGRADLRADPPRDLRRLRPGPRGGRRGRHDPHGVQRCERSGGGVVPRGENPLRAHRADDRARAPIVPADRGQHPRGRARGGRGGAPPGARGRMLLTLAAFAVVLGVLIFVHEAGHFMAAKAVGIQVLRFSLGFGRPVVSFRRGETEYWISWIPFGGYVKMAGVEDEGPAGALEGGKSPVPVDPARAFDRKPLWARFVVVLAGVTMNRYGMVLALSPALPPVIARVQAGSAGERAEFKPGDRILTVDGVTVQSWQDFARTARSNPGRELAVEVLRGAGRVSLRVAPERREEKDSVTKEVRSFGFVGVGPLLVPRPGALGATRIRWQETHDRGALILGFLAKFVTGKASPRELGGPLLIGQISGQAARVGLGTFLGFMAFLSVNLAILNLLPIPILDGGQAAFLVAEAVRRKPLPLELRLRLTQIGFVVLLGIMILATSNDILRWLGHVFGR